MKIAIFFTYDYSIETLSKSGLLERELKIYQKINEIYGTEFIFLTYEESIEQHINNYPEFKFIPIYKYLGKSNNKLIRFLKSFFIPFKIKSELLDVDVLYQHQLLGVWIPLLLKIQLNKPLQVRTGYDAYLFSLKNNDNFLKSIFYKYLTKLALRFSDLYTVTSKCDKDFLSKKFNVNSTKVVPNWIEINDHQPLTKDSEKILMVGRLEKQKNYPFAFDFLKSINANYELDIYGSGTEYSNLKTLSFEQTLNINFLGNITHQNLIREFSNYNFFLTTSTYEGNPKSVLEALSSQCIVFASNIPSHQELIKDGVNGFLFSDIKELVKKFEFIKNNLSEQSKIKKNCLSSLSENHISTVSKLMYEDYVFLTSLR
tara:strand:+ start:14981 stop:16096 length:1116 start_codon:yes stop_codon:yes gene_type:complete